MTKIILELAKLPYSCKCRLKIALNLIITMKPFKFISFSSIKHYVQALSFSIFNSNNKAFLPLLWYYNNKLILPSIFQYFQHIYVKGNNRLFGVGANNGTILFEKCKRG